MILGLPIRRIVLHVQRRVNIHRETISFEVIDTHVDLISGYSYRDDNQTLLFSYFNFVFLFSPEFSFTSKETVCNNRFPSVFNYEILLVSQYCIYGIFTSFSGYLVS